METAKSGGTKPSCGSKETPHATNAGANAIKGGVKPSSAGTMPTSTKAGGGKR